MRPRQPTGLGGCPPHLSHLTDGPRRGWGLPSPSVTCPFVATPDKQNRSSRTDPPLGALVARNRVCLGSFLALGRHRCGAGPEIRAGVATPPHLSHSTRGAQLQQGCQNRSKKLGLAVPDQRNRTKFRTNPDSPFDLFILGLIFRLGPAPLRCRPSCPVCNRRLKRACGRKHQGKPTVRTDSTAHRTRAHSTMPLVGSWIQLAGGDPRPMHSEPRTDPDLLLARNPFWARLWHWAGTVGCRTTRFSMPRVTHRLLQCSGTVTCLRFRCHACSQAAYVCTCCYGMWAHRSREPPKCG